MIHIHCSEFAVECLITLSVEVQRKILGSHFSLTGALGISNSAPQAWQQASVPAEPAQWPNREKFEAELQRLSGSTEIKNKLCHRDGGKRLPSLTKPLKTEHHRPEHCYFNPP